MSTGDYPLGAQYDSRAPYNEKENPEVEVNVVVTVVHHKTFKVKVKDYTIIDEYPDEYGNYCCEKDFSSCDLYSAVEEQVNSSTDFKDWTEDEFEVTLDN